MPNEQAEKRKSNPHAKQLAAIAAVMLALDGLTWDERRRVLMAASTVRGDDQFAEVLSKVR